MGQLASPVNIKTRRAVDGFLASPTNVAAAAALATTAPTATKPVTGAGVIVVDLIARGIDNHLIVWPYSSIATTPVDLLCEGWKKNGDSGIYEPLPLAQVQWTPDSANGQTIAGATLFPCLGIVKNWGDAKLYAGGATYKTNGGFVLDTWSFDLLTFQPTKTSGATPNVNLSLTGA